MTEATYCRWRSEYFGLKVDQVKRLQVLEQENGRLRWAVADMTVEKLVATRCKIGHADRRKMGVEVVAGTGCVHPAARVPFSERNVPRFRAPMRYTAFGGVQQSSAVEPNAEQQHASVHRREPLKRRVRVLPPLKGVG